MRCCFEELQALEGGAAAEYGAGESSAVGLNRVLTEIEDPSEMAMVIVRLSAESRKVVGVGVIEGEGHSLDPIH